MGVVSTSLAEKATSIFADLGYTVSRTENEILAERKWRVVHVTPEPSTIPTDGQFRCFVTDDDDATATYRRVAMAEPEYDWAVIGIGDDGEYDIYRPELP